MNTQQQKTVLRIRRIEVTPQPVYELTELNTGRAHYHTTREMALYAYRLRYIDRAASISLADANSANSASVHN